MSKSIRLVCLTFLLNLHLLFNFFITFFEFIQKRSAGSFGSFQGKSFLVGLHALLELFEELLLAAKVVEGYGEERLSFLDLIERFTSLFLVEDLLELEAHVVDLVLKFVNGNTCLSFSFTMVTLLTVYSA